MRSIETIPGFGVRRNHRQVRITWDLLVGNWAPTLRKGNPMFEFYVLCRRRRERLRESPFGEILEPLGEWLRQQGYSRETGSYWFLLLQHFGVWFASKGYSQKSLCQEHIQQFLAARRRRPPTSEGRADNQDGRRSVFPKAMSLLASRRSESDANARHLPMTMFVEYEMHLRDRCGLADDTICRNLNATRDFHRYAFGSEKARWRALKPCVVLNFFRHQIDLGKRNKNLRGYLWHYLQFLKLKGHDVEKLIEVLPRIRQPARSLPGKILSRKQLAQWLAGFDRSRAEGSRDYAMALCLADLGMRVGDLAVLRLGDIDWRKGTIRIPNAKRHRPYWLSLPQRVGRAIADYLRRDRPQSKQREVFVRHRTPWLKPLTPIYINHRLRYVALAQGLKPPLVGTHAFRHTFATRLLNCGSSLKEVADILGHEDIHSTTIYAQLDQRELSLAVRHWPEVKP
jgi:integrase/recombinase XerD